MRRFSLDNKQKFTEKDAFAELEKFYNSLPETEGCIKHINKKDGCGSWCCLFQNPQVLKVEFLYLWDFVLNNFDFNIVIQLIELSLRNYLSTDISKRCIFWDEDSKLCLAHKARCFNCRIYGITPDDEFNERYESFKAKYKDEIGAVIRKQCNLVSIKNGGKVTKEDIDSWWEQLKTIEQSIGVPENAIHDGEEGTYRTYHDYILMRFLPEDILHQMTFLRLNGGIEGKEQFIMNAMKYLKEKISALSKEKEDGQ